MSRAKTVLDTFNWRLNWLVVDMGCAFEKAQTADEVAALMDQLKGQVARLRWEYKTMCLADYEDETNKDFNALPNLERVRLLADRLVQRYGQFCDNAREALDVKQRHISQLAANL